MSDTAGAVCRVCGNGADNRPLGLREMMFGTRERFAYTECGRCGCVQIDQVPADLGRHYPANYYSFGPPPAGPAWKRMLKRRRGRAAFGGGDPLGALVNRLAPEPGFFGWMRRAGQGPGARVLDVGSGQGVVLREMHLAGFSRLTGVDPFLGADAEPLPGLRLLRREVSQVEGEYDVVMLNHSFEHMAHPAAVMRELRRLVAPGGTVMIRIPVAGTFAARTYGADWIQLDPPRHLFIHTEDSMARLAADAGLGIHEVVYDSNGLQFWGSELYRRGLSLRDPHTGDLRRLTDVFTRGELRAWERRARELNRRRDGDQAAFFLRRA